MAANCGLDGGAHDRRVPAARGRTRARGGRAGEPRGQRDGNRDESAHGRDSRPRERPDVQPERVPRRNGQRAAQPRRAGSLRAGLDLQSRHGVGRHRRKGDADQHVDRHKSRPRLHQRTETDHRGSRQEPGRALLHRRHRQVEQHRRNQNRVQGWHGTDEPFRVAVRVWPRVVAGFPGRESRYRLEPGKVDRERARVGVDGLSDWRHAAADGDGRQFGRKRGRAC